MRKQVKGFENYQIDHFGNVSNKDGLLMLPYITDSGYLRIEIDNKHRYIHKLVAENYIDNPFNKPQINHINCDKLDNYYLNLEWVTNSENMLHAVANKLTNHNLPLAALHGSQNKPKQIEQCDLSGNIVAIYDSVKDVKRQTGWQISGCLSGKYKTVKGFIFRFKQNTV